MQTESGTPLRPDRKDAPSVLLFRSPGSSFVRKSYANCNRLIRETVGRWAINRECWALKKLAESRHTPALIRQTDPFSMDCEFVEGTPLECLRVENLNPDKLRTQVDSLLEDLHRAQVAHGDLGHDFWQAMGRETNLIWTRDERLVAIDFAGAVPINSRLPILNSLGAALTCHDQLLKNKIRYHFPSGPTTTFVGLEWPQSLWELLRCLGKI